MSNAGQRLRSLVEGLYIATEKGELRWTPVENSRTYMCQIGESRAEILQVGNDVRINIYGPSGDEVDSFDDTYFRDVSPKNIPHDSYFMAMTALLQSARRTATGADRVIDSIISSLGTPEVSDEPPF